MGPRLPGASTPALRREVCQHVPRRPAADRCGDTRWALAGRGNCHSGAPSGAAAPRAGSSRRLQTGISGHPRKEERASFLGHFRCVSVTCSFSVCAAGTPSSWRSPRWRDTARGGRDLWGRRRQECPWLRLDTKAAIADGSAAAAWRREGVGARARAGRTGGRVSPESFRNRCCRVATRTVPALCCV